MRRRTLLSTVLIAVTAVLLLGVPLGVVGTRLMTASATSRLEREADRAATRLAALRKAGQSVDAAAVASVAAPGHRLEVRLADGTILAGGDPVDHGFRVAADGPGVFRSVVVIAPADERSEHQTAVWLAVAILSSLAITVAVVLALLQARRLSRPLETVARRAAGIGRPGFAHPPADSGVAEVDAVDRALIDADARIADLLRAEREFSANVSHQLRGPVTGLRLRLEEIALLGADAPDLEAEAQAALGQADRLMETISHVEALARGLEQTGPPVDLAAVARDQAETWRARFAAAGRGLTVAAAAAAEVTLPEEALRQIVDVLLDNALAHGAGTADVRVARVGGWCRLVVQDAGAGVPEAERARVFERGHSRGEGSGVGLSLARDLARRGGGELRLTGPARFEALLPEA
jgi:signal transduction histidine kinase